MFFYSESNDDGGVQGFADQTDPYFDNVGLLLKMDNDFSDSSVNNHTVTVAGDASIDTTTKKYGDGAGYLDGSGDVLYVTGDSSLAIGTGDFTIETWAYFPILRDWMPLIETNHYTNGILWRVMGNGSIGMWFSNAGGPFCPAGTVTTNQWYHIALTRESGVVKVFVDGILIDTVTNTNNVTVGNMRIGQSAHSTSEYFKGYLDDYRITVGVARYTADFTPPGSLPTQGDPVVTDPSFSNVQLLLPLDTDFSDASANSHTVTGNGNASIYSGGKFGDGALELDGDDFLNVTATPELAIGTQDFTLEMWVKRNGGSTDKFYMFNVGGLQNGAFAFYVQNGYLEAAIYPTGYTSPTIDVTPGVWTHVAVTRESGTIRIFADGNQVHSATDNSSIVNQDLKIGGQVWNQYNDNVGGFIDDVRLTIGEARYTANFTPPTEAHPTS